MRSLRAQLGVIMATAALLLTAAAAVAVIFERWQEDNGSLARDVELAAFQGSESSSPLAATASVPGANSFALLLDDGAEVIDVRGVVGQDLLGALVEDVWSGTAEVDIAVVQAYDTGGSTLHTVGVRCIDSTVCDTVIVGAEEGPFGSYLWARALWILLPALAAGASVLFATRWLVGRSLRPVEAMRAEVQEITASDLDRRIPVPRSGDELQALGTTLNSTLRHLERAVSANERFVADAAHELRSPLTGVHAALELEAGRSGSGLVTDALAEVDRATRLIDDLLVLARRQGAAPVRVETDLDDIVRQALSAASAANPEMEIARELTTVRLTADPDALRRVVDNLVENACRYGGRSVGVALQGAPTRCRIVVDDDGPGIPEDQRAAVFERFTRLDEARARATGGSGLGLAIVREIVSDHDGTVEITDSPLGGTRVMVELPV